MNFNDFFGSYEYADPPSIESYPTRLPRVLSPDDLSEYEYEDIDPTRELRLLELLPPKNEQTNSDDLLKCRVHQHLLQDMPKYEALSYTWGALHRTLPISILYTKNEQECEDALFGTPQLLMALRRLRLPDRSRLLWIDQLCINQNNVAEIGPQIQLMGDIYKTAEEVVVWLGESGAVFNYETGQLQQLQRSQILESAISQIPDEPTLNANTARSWLNIDMVYHVTTLALQRNETLYEMLNRPWFTRAWVFQEASLAKKLSIQYGDLSILIEDLIRFCDIVHGIEMTSRIVRRRNLAMSTAGYEMLQHIQNIRDGILSGYGTSDVTLKGSSGVSTQETQPNTFLWKLLRILRRVRCQKPQDLIFAFLAFQNGEGIISSAQTYTRPVEETWMDAAARIIKASQSLDIFVAIAGAKERELHIPSWVPYWSDILPYSRPFLTPTTRFCAARDTKHLWEEHADPSKLRVRGKIIDSIYTTTSKDHVLSGLSWSKARFPSFKHYTAMFISMDLTAQWARQWYYRNSDVHKIMGDYLSTKLQTLERDIMRTTLADGALGDQQPLRDVVDEMMQINARSQAIWTMRNDRDRSDMSEEELHLLDQYAKLEQLVLVAEEKQLFYTSHYQLGMAPYGIIPGDHIAIIHGSKAPCVLRTINEEKREYKILSLCYLDGWMFGKPTANVPKPHPHRRWWEGEPETFVLV